MNEYVLRQASIRFVRNIVPIRPIRVREAIFVRMIEQLGALGSTRNHSIHT